MYDENKNLVRTEKFTSMQAGEFSFTWDGLDYNGNAANSGQYNVYFSAESASGATVFVDTEVSGTVTAVEQGDGDTYFRLGDGRKISFTDIRKVIQPVVAETQE